MASVRMAAAVCWGWNLPGQSSPPMNEQFAVEQVENIPVDVPPYLRLRQSLAPSPTATPVPPPAQPAVYDGFEVTVTELPFWVSNVFVDGTRGYRTANSPVRPTATTSPVAASFPLSSCLGRALRSSPRCSLPERCCVAPLTRRRRGLCSAHQERRIGPSVRRKSASALR